MCCFPFSPQESSSSTLPEADTATVREGNATSFGILRTASIAATGKAKKASRQMPKGLRRSAPKATGMRHEFALFAMPNVWSAILLSLVVGFTSFSAGPLSADSPSEIRLLKKQFASGELVGVTEQDELSWKHPNFTAPFAFPLESVTSVTFAAPAEAITANGQFGLYLQDGSLLYGDLTALNEDLIGLRTTAFGELKLKREQVQRIFRWSSGEDCLYVGPGSASQWKQTADSAWQQSGHGLITEIPGSQLSQDISLPDRAIIEIKIGWQQAANFRLLLGSDPNADAEDKDGIQNQNQQAQQQRAQAINTRQQLPKPSQAFAIEAWDGDLVLLRELDKTADIMQLDTLAQKNGYLQLSILLDQTSGRIMVQNLDGKVLGDMTLTGKDVKPQTGLLFKVMRGTTRLDSLVIREGNEGMFTSANQNSATVWTENQDAFEGTLQSLTDEGKSLVFDVAGESKTIAAADVLQVILNRPQTTVPNIDAAQHRIALSTHSGMRILGKVQSVEKGQLTLLSENSAAPVQVDFNNIRDFTPVSTGEHAASWIDKVDTTDLLSDILSSKPASLSSPKPTDKPENANQLAGKSNPGRIGVFRSAGTELRGRLENGQSSEQESCFVFASILASNAVALNPKADGQIVYRESPPSGPPTTTLNGNAAIQMQVAMQRVVVNGVVQTRRVNVNGKKPRSFSSPTLHLRSGDTVECEILSINEDETSIRYKGDLKAILPNDQIRAIELMAVQTNTIEPEKQERLLTVPRMRRDNPPTHLLVSTDGDYLRGRLTYMDDRMVRIETRLEEREIDRKYIAQIIWLHADEIRDFSTDEKDDEESDQEADDSEKETSPEAIVETPKDADLAGQVQAIRADNSRLSFAATSVKNGVIAGINPYLGECTQEIKSVDRLLFGKSIRQDDASLPFAEWRLQHAPDPLVFRAGAGGGMDGQGSPLVGQPAPDFELKLLSGENYRLSEHKGQVIVLDFWASWCGPCMQAMPGLDAMIEEFNHPNLQLVAVNLQESEERIRQALERLKIDPIVAMDETGDIAQCYEATAIPQTVVITPDGKVSHLFVGGGARTLEQLRSAISEALN